MDLRTTKFRDDLKRSAAVAAVAEVGDGMVVGLGTGTTAAFAIEALGKRVAEGLRIITVASSAASAKAATAAGLKVVEFGTLASVDVCIDGADEIDPDLRAIKGAGGALLREKVVAAAAARMIAIIDESKQVEHLGAHRLPVEILPFASGFVARKIEEMGAPATRRMTGILPYRTDQQNFILDCQFGAIAEPNALAALLSAIPGVLGHGLFLSEIDAAYIGTDSGVRRVERTNLGVQSTDPVPHGEL